MERWDVVAIVLPVRPTIVNRTTVAIFEIARVCPETVVAQFLNLIGTLNCARAAIWVSIPMPQLTSVGLAGKDPWLKVVDADWPVVRSVMLAVRTWVDGERVMEAENSSPGLTVSANPVKIVIGGVPKQQNAVAASYLGVELPKAHSSCIPTINVLLEFAIPIPMLIAWRMPRRG